MITHGEPSYIWERLKDIQNPLVREQAMRNFRMSIKMDDTPSRFTVISQAQAIETSFTWSDTPEGHSYWSSISSQLRRNNL